MRKDLTWRNAFVVVLAFGLSFGLGSYLYTQQQEVSDLQQQIDKLPGDTDKVAKVALVKDSLVLKNTIVVGLVQGVGGLLLFVTVYISLQNLKATQRNVLVAEEKQVTERFTQAINQIGSDKIEVRLGGIYALERIAKDSPKDHWTIIEVLSAFVREKSPLQISNETSEEVVESLARNFLTGVSRDIQAALTVIGRRNTPNDPEDATIDLSRTNLRSVNLASANLRKVNLRFSDLSSANLNKANLREAVVAETILNGTILLKADLYQVSFETATFGRGLLQETDLREAKNITPEQIKKAMNWREAYYDKEFQEKLGLPLE